MNHLKANLKSAAELVSLPTTVEELQKVKAKWNRKKRTFVIAAFTQESINILVFVPKTDWVVFSLFKSVATIGSSLTSVQHDVRTMQAALENQKKEDDSKKTMVNSSLGYYEYFLFLMVVTVTGWLENISELSMCLTAA